MNIDILIHTALKRPYVIAFLLSYIIIAWRSTRSWWMLIYLAFGFTIAFISEYLSINYGFPYGWYFYKYENLQGEWLNQGVPVWDSVSYVFMNFAALYAAHYSLCHPGHGASRSDATLTRDPQISRLNILFLSALLVTLLDVIIDPISHMGARWFLGEIYYYPSPGIYFDVPFSNFAGWFITSLAINGVALYVLNFTNYIRRSRLNDFLALGLYYGIFGFGIAITVYLQEWWLLLFGLGWIGLTLWLLFNKKTTNS
jgi:uncharacterized membrane protein